MHDREKRPEGVHANMKLGISECNGGGLVKSRAGPEVSKTSLSPQSYTPHFHIGQINVTECERQWTAWHRNITATTNDQQSEDTVNLYDGLVAEHSINCTTEHPRVVQLRSTDSSQGNLDSGIKSTTRSSIGKKQPDTNVASLTKT